MTIQRNGMASRAGREKEMERPHVPDLKQLSELEDSSDEEGDEQHLLTILKKLQSAKSSLDISKQRKRKRESLNDIYQQYVRDSKAIVERYEQRWKSYLNEVRFLETGCITTYHIQRS